MAISAVSHVSLTVSDLDRSARWYGEVLGWAERNRGRSDTTEYASGTLPNGPTLVLRVHDAAVDGAFDERRVGLDHLSFAAEADDLDEIVRRLDATGSTYSPVVTMPYGQVLNLRDPDNIALELIVLATG